MSNAKQYYFTILNTYETLCSLLLLSTAFLKLIALLTNEGQLNSPDHVFKWLKHSDVLLFAVIIEITVAIILFLISAHMFRLLIILWLAVLFLLYRILLSLELPNGYCNCLGILNMWFPAQESFFSMISFFLLLFMLLPPIIFILRSKYYCISL